MGEKCARVRAGRKKHLRMLAAMVGCCVILAAYPHMPLTLSVFAEEEMSPDRSNALSVSENTEGRDSDAEGPEESGRMTGGSGDSDGRGPGGMTDGGGESDGKGPEGTTETGAGEIGNTAESGDGTGAAEEPEKAVDHNGGPEEVETVSENDIVNLTKPMADEAPGDISRAKEPEAKWRTAEQADNEWQQGSLEEAIAGVESGGTVKLLSDVSLTDGITITASGQVNITSVDKDAPRTIKNVSQDTDDRETRGRIFTVNGGPVVLQDIILDGGRREGTVAHHPLVCVTGVGMILEDGAVLQHAENASQSFCGGGINIRRGQVFMYDGSEIMGCKARHGGGIEVNSAGAYTAVMLGMAGGSIVGCEAVDGGGVYVNIGRFQMQGGEIVGCRSTRESWGHGGGGICLTGGERESQTAAVLIAAGKVAGNEASVNGGGILLFGQYASCQMSGGTVGGSDAGESNRAENGGGISVLRGNLKLYGGTVTGNHAEKYGGGILGSPDSLIELQGNPKVYDNTAGDSSDRFDNLYLDGNENSGTDVTLPIALTGQLTNGVRLGLSRWVRPDENAHPYRKMIVSAGDLPQSSGRYKMTEADAGRLAKTREEEEKQLYADNTEKYAFVKHEGKIVMILAPDVVLDRERITFAEADETASLIATVQPANALIKDVIWSSSDENVAKVDERGNVTAVGEGRAVIKATTVSPYHAAASCEVTVGAYYQAITREEHGKITYRPGGPLLEGEVIRLTLEPDRGYQLREDSIKVFKTGEASTEVALTENTFVMPDYDVTVTAVFEPIVYPITYELDGGSLSGGDSNPAAYTIESATITLKNPKKEGFTFKGWTGTDLQEKTKTVTIPRGSTGARTYTAVWEKRSGGKPKPGDGGDYGNGDNGGGDHGGKDSGSRDNDGVRSGKQIEGNVTHMSGNPQRAAAPRNAADGSLNPQTGNDMLILYMMAAASVIGLLLVGIFVWSAMKILAYNRDLKENAQELAQICAAAGISETADGQTDKKESPEPDNRAQIRQKESPPDAGQIDFAALQARNGDIRGWLACGGLAVNNPVVQAQDNAYYLRHSFMKKKNRTGCLFMDYRNESFEDRNVVIYGHNNTDRTMFGSLKNVLEDSFWEEKGAGRIDLTDTENRLRTYQIFSFYVVENEDYYISTSFESGEAYEDFLRTITGRSRRDCGVALTEEDHILTLSTCYGRAGTKRRLVIHAKEIKEVSEKLRKGE